MRRRCSWCAWPDAANPGSPELQPMTLEVEGVGPRTFCDISCAVAFAGVHGHPEVEFRARAAAGIPRSVPIDGSPAAYLCEWAESQGGLTRAMWIAHCRRPPLETLPRDTASPPPRSGKIGKLRVSAPK